jgi:hypothetical protein
MIRYTRLEPPRTSVLGEAMTRLEAELEVKALSQIYWLLMPLRLPLFACVLER